MAAKVAAQQQKKAQRSKRCKSLLMLSSPFSASTSSVKSSFLSLLSPSQSQSQSQTNGTDLELARDSRQRRRLFNAASDQDLASSSVSLMAAINSSAATSQPTPPTSSPGNKPSSQLTRSKCVKMKLFEQPLDKLFSPKAMKQLNLAISGSNNNNSPEMFNKRNKRLSSSSACLRKFSSINITDANNNNTPKQQQTTQQLQTQFQRQHLLLSVIPEPIRNLLNELYQRGPSTIGIFRKSPNAKHCRDLRQKLETDSQSSIEQFQVTVIASVFKEWLRSLPDCLLMSRLYPQWIDVAKLIEPLHQRQQQRQNHLGNLQSQSLDDSLSDNTIISNASLRPTRSLLTDNGQPLDRAYSCSTMTPEFSISSSSGSKNNLEEFGSNDSGCSPASSDYLTTMDNGAGGGLNDGGAMSAFALSERHSECLRIICQLLDALDESNLILLRAFIGVLRHIADNSELNKMSANNLGVCVGQSLLNDEHQSNTKTAASTFTKRHRRTRSHCFLSSTLSLTSSSTNISNGALLQNACQLSSNSAQETAKYVPILVAFMIENAPTLFGQDITDVFSSTTTNTYNQQERDRSKSEINFSEASEMVPMDLTLTGKENESPDSYVDQVDCGAIPSFSASPSSSSSSTTPTSPSSSSSADSTSSNDSPIKRVASPKQHIVIEGRFHVDHESDCNISNNDRNEDGGSTTTSILIVNRPQSKRLQPNQESASQIGPDTAQCRPLSVTGSTASSSRASSSTSGVHSNSPAFSSELDSSNARTTTSSPSSVSSPSSSATSPVQEESPSQESRLCSGDNLVDIGVNSPNCTDHYGQDRHHVDLRRRSENLVNSGSVLPETRQTHRSHHMVNRYSTFMGILNRVPKIPVQYTTSCYGGEAVIYNPKPRPRSMGRFETYNAQIGNEQSLDTLNGNHEISVESSVPIKPQLPNQAQNYSMEREHLKSQCKQDFLSHAHPMHRPASLVATPSLPYLPHSNYINPSCHPSFRSQHQQAANFGTCQQAPRNISYVQEHPIFYSTTNLSASQQQYQDRYMLYHRAALEPRRSRVLSLRDYYLSLQARQLQHQNSYAHHQPCHAQQHPQLLAQQQQRVPANNQTRLSSHPHPHHCQNQQQESHSVVKQQPHQFENGSMVTPIQAKIGMTNHQNIQRSQPRMAKIRQNQFNGIYVKQGPALGSSMMIGGCLDRDSAGCGLKANSNLAFKPTSSENSSDESDEYMNDWIESTMV